MVSGDTMSSMMTWCRLPGRARHHAVPTRWCYQQRVALLTLCPGVMIQPTRSRVQAYSEHHWISGLYLTPGNIE